MAVIDDVLLAKPAFRIAHHKTLRALPRLIVGHPYGARVDYLRMSMYHFVDFARKHAESAHLDNIFDAIDYVQETLFVEVAHIT